MSESQNNNQDPTSADDEKNRATAHSEPYDVDGPQDVDEPQDVSGSFRIAQNPEQFFHGSINASAEDGAMHTRSFSFASSQFDPDPATIQAFNPNVFGLNREPEGAYNPEPSAVINPYPSATPDAVPASPAGFSTHPSAGINSNQNQNQNQDQYQNQIQNQNQNSNPNPNPNPNLNPGSNPNQARSVMNPEPSAVIDPGPSHQPHPAPAVNHDPSSAFQPQDFFDNFGRRVENPQSFASQPQVFDQLDPSAHALLESGQIANPHQAPVRPPTQDARRSPAGFFDAETAPPSTAGSALQPGAAPANPKPQNYNPAVSAQQAFFAGNDVPALPSQAAQTNSSFQDFYQDPSPAGQQFSDPGQQPGPGQLQHPGASQNLAANRLADQSPQQNQPAQTHNSGERQSALSHRPVWNQEPNQQANQQPSQQTPTGQPHVQPGLPNSAAQQYPDPSSQNAQLGQTPLPHPTASTPRAPGPGEPSAPEPKLKLPEEGGSRSKDLPPPAASGPTSTKRKKRRPQPDEDETATDFSQATVQIDNFKRFEKLVASPETKGLFMLALQDARHVLLHPEEFFKAMPTRGNIAEPAIFLFILAGVSGLLAGVISMNLLISIQFFIGNCLQAFFLSFICWKIFTGMGSTEPFEANFRVIAYSSAALVIAGLKFNFFGNYIPAYITLLIATVIALRLQILGMKQVHDMPAAKVMPVIVLSTLFILLIRFKIFLL
ncbi:MAG: YIP1 family protein [Candidatus Melainabacteria bacterium]|nr:YIP1 family protein [Candidatus Melainabacteria bacterium]